MKLKNRLKEMIHNAFQHKNGSIRYKFITLGFHKAYFVNSDKQKGKTCYTKEQVVSMLEFLIDNIFVEFGGRLFQQIVGIPMGTNCAPLLADLFLFSYESEFLQTLVKNKKIKEARLFNFTFRYIDDVLSINNPNFSDWVPLIYPPELEIKETTDTASSASFLDLYLEFDIHSHLSTRIYDKRDDFDFEIINFTHLSNNIPTTPAYGIFHRIRYSRASGCYLDFVKRHQFLSRKLINQGYVKVRLVLFLKKFIGRYQELVDKYSVSTSQIIQDGLEV